VTKPPLSDKADAVRFMGHMEALFGKKAVIRKVGGEDGRPRVWCFIWRDLPEPGFTTGVTYGLSEAEHPAWKLGRPELLVSLKTEREDWAFCAAYFASTFWGEKKFSYGDLFTLDEPITEGSAMSGFVVFGPSLLDRAQAKVELDRCTVNIVGMHPIYAGEAALIQSKGFDAWWGSLSQDGIYEVDRPDVSVER